MLLPGDIAPNFTAASTVNPKFHFDTAAGRYIVLTFFATSTVPFSARLLEEIRRRKDRFDVTNLMFFGVSVDPEDPHRLTRETPGIIYFWDFDLDVSRKFGIVTEGAATTVPATPDAAPATDAATGGEHEAVVGGGAADDAVTDDGGAAPGAAAPASTSTQYQPRTFVLDQALRVLAVVGFSDDPVAHLDGLLKFVEALPKPETMTGPAPVLVIPYVFEPELCRTLITYYEANGGEESGFMRDVGGKTVGLVDYSHKRRKDCEITDQSLIRTTQERLARRVLPAIKQAFQFNANRIERHIVACYDAKDGGHFRAHRDNTTLGTAHRRFAVTMNLNADEFDGGELWFPEFGRRTYKATTGGVVVFSCSLLHEAKPVTRGTRYAFLPFLYDDAAARLRDRNRQHLVGGPAVVQSAETDGR